MKNIRGEETREEIVKLLKKEGPMIQKDIAKKLGMASPTISHHIPKLEREGRVRVVKMYGREVYEAIK